MLDEVLDDLKVAVEAGGPQRGRVRLRGAIDGGAATHQVAHDVDVPGGGGHPQGRRSLDGLAVERHWRERRGDSTAAHEADLSDSPEPGCSMSASQRSARYSTTSRCPLRHAMSIGVAPLVRAETSRATSSRGR